MGWIKITDDFSCNAKIMDADDAGLLWVHLHAMCYCAANRTDGLIHRRIVKMDPEGFLVEIGLWKSIEGQTWIHDWLKYNLSKEQDDKRRKVEAEKKARWRAKQKADKASPSTVDNTKDVTADNTQGPLEPDPDPLEGGGSAHPEGGGAPRLVMPDESPYHAMERMNREDEKRRRSKA